MTLERVAKLPTRDEALATLMSVLNAPITKLARTLNEVPAQARAHGRGGAGSEASSLIDGEPNSQRTGNTVRRNKVALSKDDILNAIADMSVMEVVELVQAMEEKFGVSAAAAVAVAAGSPERVTQAVARVLRNRPSSTWF